MPPPPPPGSGRYAGAWLSALVLFAAGVWGGWVTSREWRIVALERAAADRRTDRIEESLWTACGPRCDARTALALARLATSDALLARDPARRAGELARAERLLDKALVRRPDWSVALIELSYVRTMRLGPRAPAALAALDRSFHVGKLSRQGAPWRAHLASMAWPMLKSSTRLAVLDEALWYAALDAQSWRIIEAALGSGAAASAFAVRAAIRGQADAPDEPEQQRP